MSEPTDAVRTLTARQPRTIGPFLRANAAAFGVGMDAARQGAGSSR